MITLSLISVHQTGVSQEEVSQVSVLLQSLSKLLEFGRGSSGSNWVHDKLSVTRCAEHDWCEIRQIPCSTDTPERVLISVLDKFDVWQISGLAKRWRTCKHLSDVRGFTQVGAVAEPIRAAPPRPSRSLEDMAVDVQYKYKMGVGDEPIANERCRLSSRMLRAGVSVSCGRMRLPPRTDVHVFLTARKGFVRLFLRANDYYKTNDCAQPIHWREHHICVCDANVEEMEAVLKVQRAAAEIRKAAWDARCAEIRKASERAFRAAATRRRTRRENSRKRKLACLQEVIHCLASSSSSEEYGESDPESDHM